MVQNDVGVTLARAAWMLRMSKRAMSACRTPYCLLVLTRALRRPDAPYVSSWLWRYFSTAREQVDRPL